MSTVITLAGVHFMICIGIACCCICRLGAGDKRVLRRIRTFYWASLVVSLTAAFGPVLPMSLRYWPDIVPTAIVAVVLIGFLCDSYRWRHGAPDDAKSDHAPLSELPPETLR